MEGRLEVAQGKRSKRGFDSLGVTQMWSCPHCQLSKPMAPSLLSV